MCLKHTVYMCFYVLRFVCWFSSDLAIYYLQHLSIVLSLYVYLIRRETRLRFKAVNIVSHVIYIHTLVLLDFI